MKFVFLLLSLSFVSCTHYQTSSISDNRVMVAKNINVLNLIQFGDVYTCKTDDAGKIESCVINNIEDEATRIEREKRKSSNSRPY